MRPNLPIPESGTIVGTLGCWKISIRCEPGRRVHVCANFHDSPKLEHYISQTTCIAVVRDEVTSVGGLLECIFDDMLDIEEMWSMNHKAHLREEEEYYDQ
jgi:hypothetical protein